MKHKINKISGYYEGPDGVFYDYKHDEIFELSYYGATVFRKTIMKEVGKFYRYYTKENKKGKPNSVMGGFKYVIRLGEL